MKPAMAAQRLGMSVRQIERLVIRYRADGPAGLISRHRHGTGNRALKAHVAERIIAILREQSTPGMRRRASTFTDTGGKPLAFYSEKASIFRVKHKTPTNVKGGTLRQHKVIVGEFFGTCT